MDDESVCAPTRERDQEFIPDGWGAEWETTTVISHSLGLSLEYMRDDDLTG